MSNTSPLDRLLLHLPASRRLVVKPDDIYLLEADGDDTIVRQRRKRTIRDVRRLSEMAAVPDRCRRRRLVACPAGSFAGLVGSASGC